MVREQRAAYAMTKLNTNMQEEDNEEEHLPRDTAIRVLFDISTGSLESVDKFEEVRDLINKTLPVIFKDPAADTFVPPDLNLLAIEIRGRHTFAILDAHHDAYDFLTAHEKDNNQLPVYNVRLKKHCSPIFGRAPKLDEMINGIVSKLHRLNGYEVQPPYIRDCTLGPAMYFDPRGLKMSVPKEPEDNDAEEEEVKGKVAAEVNEAGGKELAEAASEETQVGGVSNELDTA